MNDEIWLDIKGYEGRYMVSNKGRVKSLLGRTERILRYGSNKGGYLHVILRDSNGIGRTHRVHQLVAETFLADKRLPEHTDINHVDEDKTNNDVSNLQWCTHKENMMYGMTRALGMINLGNKILQNTVAVRERHMLELPELYQDLQSMSCQANDNATLV